MNHKITHTPTLNEALIKIHHPNKEVFENADMALIRAKGLSEVLIEASILANDSHYPQLSYSGITALATSLNNEIQAVQLMLHELVSTGYGSNIPGNKKAD